ncbi:MAG: TolC family protein [Bacteroidota bacterium]
MVNNVQRLYLVLVVLSVWPSLAAQSDPLDEYLQSLVSTNTDLQASRIAEQTAAARLSAAGLERRPTVDLKGDYTLAAGGRAIAFPVGDLFNPVYGTLNQLTGNEQFPTDLENVDELLAPNNFYNLRLEASLPLIAPTISRAEQLREAELATAEAQTATYELNLRSQLRSIYFGYLQTFAGAAIIDSSRQVLEELLRVNRSLVRNDLATSDIVYRTEAELSELDGQQALLLQERRRAAAGINRLLNRPAQAELRADFSPSAFDTSLLVTDLGLLLEQMKQGRPELRQIDAGINTLSALAALQEAEGLPTLGVQVQAGSQGFLTTDYSDHPYVIGGLGFNWNIYDGKRRDQQIQITQLQREEQRLRRQGIVRDLETQVYLAYHSRATAQLRLIAAAAARRAALRSLELVQARYRNQQALLVEYLDARSRWTTSELEYTNAYYDLLREHYLLLAAINQ